MPAPETITSNMTGMTTANINAAGSVTGTYTMTMAAGPGTFTGNFYVYVYAEDTTYYTLYYTAITITK
jgi:hypothetical protein